MPPRIGERRHVPDRVIDTWIYKVKDVEFENREYIEPEGEDPGQDERQENERYEMKKQRVKNKIITMRLELHKKTSQSEEPPHPTEDVHFEVYCKELDLRMSGTDIELLRTAMWEHLDKKFAIKWEGYYLVEVKESRSWGGKSGTGIQFEYDTVWRGTTWDGKFLLKKYDGSHFVIRPWPGEFTDNGGNVMACIPATEENKAALKEFCKRMDRMREVMADYLRPERILKTLADLGGAMPFLPAPSTDKPPDAAEDK